MRATQACQPAGLLGSLNQFHAASPCRVLSVEVTSHYYVRPVSWSLVCASTMSCMAWVMRRSRSSWMTTTLSTGGYVDREEEYCLRRRLKICGGCGRVPKSGPASNFEKVGNHQAGQGRGVSRATLTSRLALDSPRSRVLRRRRRG